MLGTAATRGSGDGQVGAGSRDHYEGVGLGALYTRSMTQHMEILSVVS